VSIDTIGSMDERHRVGSIPDVPPTPGTKLFPAPYALIAKVLDLDKELYLGYLHSTRFPVKLSLTKFVRGHTAVIGKTGSGKSYTVGAIVEELLTHQIPVFIVDTHSEYSFLGTTSRANRKKHVYFNIRPGSFSVNRIRWTTNDTDQERSSVNEYLLKSRPSSTSELRMTIQRKGGKSISLGDLLQSGQATILDLLGVAPSISEKIVTAILTSLFLSRRKKQIRPFALVVEEAHSFAPERGFGSSNALNIMLTIAKEARKFNMPTIFVTQRPQLISKTVLAMCQNWFILQISNPLDLEAVTSMCEGTTSYSKDLIRNLNTGTTLVSGLTQSPILVDVRCKKSATGFSKDLMSELSEYKEGMPRPSEK